jgi:hypothetical protein
MTKSFGSRGPLCLAELVHIYIILVTKCLSLEVWHHPPGCCEVEDVSLALRQPTAVRREGNFLSLSTPRRLESQELCYFLLQLALFS